MPYALRKRLRTILQRVDLLYDSSAEVDPARFAGLNRLPMPEFKGPDGKPLPVTWRLFEMAIGQEASYFWWVASLPTLRRWVHKYIIARRRVRGFLFRDIIVAAEARLRELQARRDQNDKASHMV